jgi:ribonuclease Z
MVTSRRELDIRFWGTRGNTAPFLPSVAIGNHTTAVEIRAAARPGLLVDMGTGVIAAGNAWLAAGVREFDLVFTHLHMDHLQGVFSFAPFYRKDCSIRLWAARPDLQSSLAALLAAPFHPVDMRRMPARFEFCELPESGSQFLARQGLTLSWGPLAHPQGCTGYRFDDGESALVFATDVELGAPVSHAPLEALLSEPYPAGLAIVDGFFTDSEVDEFADWGHSSPGQASQAVAKAGVGALWITHHHPKRSDQQLLHAEQAAAPARWARDGMRVTLAGNSIASVNGSPAEPG